MQLSDIFMPLLTRLGARAAGARGANEEPTRHVSALRQGIGYFLGLDDAAASTLAQVSLDAHQALRAGRPGTLRMAAQPALAQLETALQDGPCLLALPFNEPALCLLRQLAGRTTLPLTLIESPAVRDALSGLDLPAALPRCSSQDVIRHVKAACAVQAPPMLYVSFPELHAQIPGTTAIRPFMDKPCHFSLLEAVLMRSGLRSLITLGVGAAAQPAVTLVTRTARQDSTLDAGQAIGATLNWLVGQLQAVAGAWPAETLSWQYLYRASVHCQEIERDNQLKQLEAYFDAWKRADAGLSGATYGYAMERLAALRKA